MSEPDVSTARKRAAIAVAAVAAFAIVCLAIVEVVGAVASAMGVDQDVRVSESASTREVEAELADGPFYVLLIGSDSRKGTALYTGRSSEHAQIDQHSDIMTLVRVDPDIPQITLVTVPRDTVLQGSSSKINEALAANNDPMAVVAEVEKLTNVDIAYYAMTTFIGFEDLVDGIGGVTVDVPATVTVSDPSNAEDVRVAAGEDRRLDGSEALVVARARKEYGDDEEALRQVNVRNLEVSIIQKGLAAYREPETDNPSFSRMMEVLLENITTNMDESFIRGVVGQIANAADQLIVYSCTGPYEGGIEEGADLWVIKEDKEQWAHLMAVVDSGGDPTGLIEVPEFREK